MAADHDFESVYRQYYPAVLRYVARIVGQNEAEDVAQETFNKVGLGLENFRGESKLSVWIYRIATNTAIDRTRSAAYKQSSRNIAIEEKSGQERELAPEDRKPPSTDQLVIQKEMRDCINEYVDTLPADYKTIIVLSELEDLSNKEIAEILGISISNAKVRLHRARARLKTVLDAACSFYYTDRNTLACDRKQVRILPKAPK